MASATATPEPSDGDSPDRLPVTPTATPFPVPPDWLTHSKPAGAAFPAFTFRYPPTWSIDGSPEPSEFSTGSIVLMSRPPGGVRFNDGDTKVDFIFNNFQECPAGVSPIVVDGVTGTQARTVYDPPTVLGISHGWMVRFAYDGAYLCINAFFTPSSNAPDFFRIISSLQFD